MCAALLFLFQQALVPFPEPDPYGRYLTKNQYGYSDPATNEVIEAYLDWGTKTALKSPSLRAGRQNYLLEVGAGYGFVAKRAVEKGIYYLMNDRCQEHLDLAEQYQIPCVEDPGQLLTYPGIFPWAVERMEDLRTRKITGIGSFMVLHYFRPKEIRQFFDLAYDLLEPGGRAFLTVGRPYNKLFMGFRKQYKRANQQFWLSPSLEMPFPGEMEHAHTYLSHHYPSYFHALDHDILTFLAQANPAKAFHVLHTANIERPNPPEQAYRKGYRWGFTEVAGIILEKPESDWSAK